jgi:hypothetical protein
MSVTISVIIVAEKPIIVAAEAADIDTEVVSMGSLIFILSFKVM